MPLQFGLQPPDGVDYAAAWGCRAILQQIRAPQTVPGARGARLPVLTQSIDVLADRQSCVPDKLPPEFLGWLKSGLANWLERLCGEKWIEPGGRETFRLDDGPFHAIACPNASHGYLYVGAWADRKETP